jgi:hypothetical protein
MSLICTCGHFNLNIKIRQCKRIYNWVDGLFDFEPKQKRENGFETK